MTSCKAVQHSDQMVCECGNVWDMNDPDPPHCNPSKKPEQQVEQEPVEVVAVVTRDVYAAPPAAPDVSGLVDALRQVTDCLAKALTGGEVRAIDAGRALTAAGELLGKYDEAQQGENQQ